MRHHGHYHGGHVYGMIFMIIGAIAVLGGGTMLLWNVLIPTLFGLPSITFFQAAGLVVLTRLLFGSHAHALMFVFGHHGFHNRMRQRWEEMAPEERERWLSGHGFRGRGCRNNVQQHHDEPAATDHE